MKSIEKLKEALDDVLEEISNEADEVMRSVTEAIEKARDPVGVTEKVDTTTRNGWLEPTVRQETLHNDGLASLCIEYDDDEYTLYIGVREEGPEEDAEELLPSSRVEFNLDSYADIQTLKRLFFSGEMSDKVLSMLHDADLNFIADDLDS